MKNIWIIIYSTQVMLHKIINSKVYYKLFNNIYKKFSLFNLSTNTLKIFFLGKKRVLWCFTEFKLDDNFIVTQ